MEEYLRNRTLYGSSRWGRHANHAFSHVWNAMWMIRCFLTQSTLSVENS